MKNGTLYEISYLYAASLLSMTLSSDLAVVVSSFTILVDYILINLRLLLLAYYLLNPLFICQENSITFKSQLEWFFSICCWAIYKRWYHVRFSYTRYFPNFTWNWEIMYPFIRWTTSHLMANVFTLIFLQSTLETSHINI